MNLMELEELARSGDTIAEGILKKIDSSFKFKEELFNHLREMGNDMDNGRQLTDAEQHWLTATESLMLERGWIDETIN